MRWGGMRWWVGGWRGASTRRHELIRGPTLESSSRVARDVKGSSPTPPPQPPTQPLLAKKTKPNQTKRKNKQNKKTATQKQGPTRGCATRAPPPRLGYDLHLPTDSFCTHTHFVVMKSRSRSPTRTNTRTERKKKKKTPFRPRQSRRPTDRWGPFKRIPLNLHGGERQ